MESFIFLGKTRYTKTKNVHFTLKSVLDPACIDRLDVLFFYKAAHYVPYLVKSYAWQQHSLNITLMPIETESIEHFFQKKIFIQASQIKKKNTTISDDGMGGYQVWQKTMYIGVINKMEIYPSQKMIKIQGEKNTLLVPWHPELIKNIDHSQKKIFLQLPADYVDIFSEPVCV